MPQKKGEELLFFPSGKFLNLVTAGFKTIYADFIWIEGGIYYGKHRLSDREYPYLFHIMDIITDLDSRFINAYTLGAFLLADDANRIDLAEELLDKGISHNPRKWHMPFVKGFINYMYTKDYKKASKWFILASLKKDAPDMVTKFATWTTQLEKGIEVSLKLWLRFYYNSSSEIMKQKALKGIIKIIENQKVKFRKENGRYPKSLEEMREKGYLPFIPPLGTVKLKLKENRVVIE